MDRFLAEVDSGRRFSADTLIGDVLDYASAEGFGAVMRQTGAAGPNDAALTTARRFRERYLLAALDALGRG